MAITNKRGVGGLCTINVYNECANNFTWPEILHVCFGCNPSEFPQKCTHSSSPLHLIVTVTNH